jgi:WXG100 family type VII secretion target
MSLIKVTAEDLTSTASFLGTSAQSIAETNSAAMSQVNALVGGGWLGAGSAAFEAAMQEWQTGAAQVQDALSKIGSLVSTAASTYSSTDSQIASSFGG